MDALEYCNDKAAIQGTPGYYTVLFHPATVRAGLVALRALERELSDVVELCTDRDIALHKLNYWRQELDGNSPSAPHPVTRALQQYAGGVLDNEARGRLLDGTAQRILRPQFHSESEIDKLCAATAGTIAQACARIADNTNTDVEAGTVAVAIAAERLRLLSMPRRAGLPSHSGIALSTLTACAVTPAQVDHAGSAPALIMLRTSLLEQVLAAIEHADKLVERRQGYIATNLRITRCLLVANRRADYAGSGRLCRVAPLQLLWHAWRAKS